MSELARDGQDNAVHPENGLSINLRPLRQQAQVTDDRGFAKDLEFCADVAQSLTDTGARTMVVGGYVRDLALSELTGTRAVPGDLDLEVYGMPLRALQSNLAGHGPVHLVGRQFPVLKLTNPETGSILDFSVPRRRVRAQPELGSEAAIVDDPTISIEEAARYRDFTVNSLALDPLTGELFDPRGGVRDMEERTLRAADIEHFADDPVRVLRAVQLASRLKFSVGPVLTYLSRNVDVTRIPGEQVGGELVKALVLSEKPSIALETARQLGVIERLYPELAALVGVPQDPEKHPEGDVWTHTKLVVDAAARISREEDLSEEDQRHLMLAALCHDFGKPETTTQGVRGGLIAHGHETAGLKPAEEFLKRLRMPKKTINIVLALTEAHLFTHSFPDDVIPKDTVLKRFHKRLKPASVYLWDLLCRADANGRGIEWQETTRSHEIYQRIQDLQLDQPAVESIFQGAHLTELGLRPGPQIGLVLDRLRQLQIGGAFSSLEEGLQYIKTHPETVAVEEVDRE